MDGSSINDVTLRGEGFHVIVTMCDVVEGWMKGVVMSHASHLQQDLAREVSKMMLLKMVCRVHICVCLSVRLSACVYESSLNLCVTAGVSMATLGIVIAAALVLLLGVIIVIIIVIVIRSQLCSVLLSLSLSHCPCFC